MIAVLRRILLAEDRANDINDGATLTTRGGGTHLTTPLDRSQLLWSIDDRLAPRS